MHCTATVFKSRPSSVELGSRNQVPRIHLNQLATYSVTFTSATSAAHDARLPGTSCRPLLRPRLLTAGNATKSMKRAKSAYQPAEQSLLQLILHGAHFRLGCCAFAQQLCTSQQFLATFGDLSRALQEERGQKRSSANARNRDKECRNQRKAQLNQSYHSCCKVSEAAP